MRIAPGLALLVALSIPLSASCGKTVGAPAPGILVALAQFEVGPDGKVLPKPRAARLDLVSREGRAWRVETLEDPDSNVFHKAMAYAPGSGREPGILTLGGTVLGSSNKANPKHHPVGRNADGSWRFADLTCECLDTIKLRGIEALVVIGGNGSQAGGYALSQMGFPVVGVASTIDNDLVGSDITIGVDTALNTMVDIIDMIKDTASSHQRCFLVQVMGRHHGYLALIGGIIGGAEVTVLPEKEQTLEEILLK